MRNFKEILQFRIEQALDDGFAKHIPLTSDYLAEKLLATLDKENGELMQMARHQAAMLLLNNDMSEEQRVAAINLAVDMLLNPVEHLIPEELANAYNIQQHEYDKVDIEEELEIASEGYIEEYGIDQVPVTDDEIERMANALRRTLDDDVDECWSYAKAKAVHKVLDARTNKEEN